MFSCVRHSLSTVYPACVLINRFRLRYMIMRDCWSYHPNERPMFDELVESLDQILSVTANQEYVDFGLPQLDTPPTSQESFDENDLVNFAV